jgi:hypothetical protein
MHDAHSVQIEQRSSRAPAARLLQLPALLTLWRQQQLSHDVATCLPACLPAGSTASPFVTTLGMMSWGR